jgi:phosphoenolpyruvate phosphomutase / 2-hydroxyethylphosphonate cytidylyltransferase
MKTVFVVMSAEFFHPGHLNIIQVARELGEVTIGLATDEFNARYKRLAVMSYEQRKSIVENIKGVKRVIPQETLNLALILRELKPDYFVHGDDWKTGRLTGVRQQVIDVLAEWGGTLIEPPYTEGISSTQLNTAWHSIDTTPENRTHRFRRLLAYQPVVRILEVHNGLTGLIVEQTQVQIDGKIKEFDAMLYSGLTDSLSKGKPDIGYVDLTSRMNTIHDILGGTTKPLLVDEGKGGLKEHFLFTVKTLERLGVSAVVIEDRQEDIHEFAQKISSGKKAQVTADFSIIARMNSLVFSRGVEDALFRAEVYLKAGADAVMIQSQPDHLVEFFEFCRLFAKFENRIPLLAALPASTWNENPFLDAGVQGIIYSDHLLRAAYTYMRKTAEMLLRQSLEVGDLCPVNEICDFVPGIQE